MNDISAVSAALSRRARIASAQGTGPGAVASPGTDVRTARGGLPEPGLIDSLRQHLLAGETHYPVRPGMVELRERLGERLVEIGLPDRGADGVLITASEGEALFVTLLGLDVFPKGSLTGAPGGRHQALLDWLEIPIEPDPDGADVGLRYHDPRSGVSIRVVGDTLFRDHPTVGAPDDILMGTLDALDGMAPFTLGFVAAAPDVVKRITKWKQASSICSPGPSQRAALWALETRP